MIKDVLSIFENNVEVEKLFNQNRDITHYRRNRFNATTIEILMMFRMHTNKNANVISSNDIEKKKKFSNSNIYVKTNLSSFSKLNEVINENQKIENLIDDLKLNVIFENDENVISANDEIEKIFHFQKTSKILFCKFSKKTLNKI